MKIGILCFTNKGEMQAKKIKEQLSLDRVEIVNFHKKRESQIDELAQHSDESEKEHIRSHESNCTIKTWMVDKFHNYDAFLFIGAAGIAVRTIAPFLKSKLEDPAVLVMDELGNYVIPILSGHVGGANELAIFLEEKMGATAVITTATDVNKAFAVDMFAKKNDLTIVNKDGIAKVSAKVLEGKEIKIYEYRGQPETGNADVIISPYVRCGNDVLYVKYTKLLLCPKVIAVGIGCRKGISAELIEEKVWKIIDDMGIAREAVYAVASIDIKKEEPGIKSFCEKHQIPFITYTKEKLEQIPGEFSASTFVASKVGVDNVCERAAMASVGTDGTLLCKKQAADGVTVAVAMKKWSIKIDEK